MLVVGTHLHLPLLHVGRLSIAAEEPLVVRPHQAGQRAQQQLLTGRKELMTDPTAHKTPVLPARQQDSNSSFNAEVDVS